jgi:hypothetical protein
MICILFSFLVPLFVCAKRAVCRKTERQQTEERQKQRHISEAERSCYVDSLFVVNLCLHSHPLRQVVHFSSLLEVQIRIHSDTAHRLGRDTFPLFHIASTTLDEADDFHIRDTQCHAL